ncbi:unnamed protein product [Owenia fusiformis]|uniref:Uncharacterized protein n=1 Tax=Owenia fusiformis TaxID=6347 RepID=A0A8J1UYB0_OWEFU|nr:unnamed protein product [Owenia fusiformis]
MATRGRWCRSKIGQTFMIILVIGLGLFALNYYAGVSFVKHDDITEEDLHNRHLMGHRHRTHHRHKKTHVKSKPTQIFDDDSGPMCKAPKLDLHHDANKGAFNELPQLQCNGVEIARFKDKHIALSKTISKQVSKCVIRGIEMKENTDHFEYKTPVTITNLKSPVKILDDFVRIDCYEHGESDDQYQNDVHKTRELKQLDHISMPNLLVPDVKQKLNKINTNHNEGQKVGEFHSPNKHNIGRHAKKQAKTIQKGALKHDNQVITKHKQPKVKQAKQSPINTQKEAVSTRKLQSKNNPSKSSGVITQFLTQVNIEQKHLEQLHEIKSESDLRTKESLDMNVLIFAIDSMSQLSFQRKLPLTYRFMKDRLDSVMLNGYNMVGDGTAGSLVPLLTGKALTDPKVPETRKNKLGTSYVDNFEFIWNKYETKGYATLFAEDNPHRGAFNLEFNGFDTQPTMHYMRPFWLATEESDLQKTSEEFCLGHKSKHMYTLEYITQFFDTYKEHPKFGFGFHRDLTQKHNDPASHMDQDFAEILRYLLENNHLNNTMLILMSDHGARFNDAKDTIQGRLEERLPMMTISLPKWFRKAYPNQMNMLKQNSEGLTTPYDIFETLYDVIDTSRWRKKPTYKDRGISLFKHIPFNRTCASAGIDLHWCSCLMYEEVAVDDPTVEEASLEIIKKVNLLSRDHRDVCSEQKLYKTLDAQLVVTTELLLKEWSTLDPYQRVANFSNQLDLEPKTYQVTVQAQPSSAIYEATLEVTSGFLSAGYKIKGDISRLDHHGDQGKCTHELFPELRKFCHCRT